MLQTFKWIVCILLAALLIGLLAIGAAIAFVAIPVIVTAAFIYYGIFLKPKE